MLLDQNLLNNIVKNIGEIKTRKANEAYQQARVRIESIDLNWDFQVITLNAYVIDTTQKQNHLHIRLSIEDGGYIYGHSCSCHPYSYQECEHMLAVLLEFNNNPKYFEKIEAEIHEEKKREEKNMFNNIIKNFENDFTEIKENTPSNTYTLTADVSLVPVLKRVKGSSGDYSLSFKIGNEKLYKIKNLEEFYTNYINKNTFKYGASLIFKHLKENFDKESLELLDFILKYGQSIYYANLALESKNSYNYSKVPSTNIILKGQAVDDFFEILKSHPYVIDLENENTVLKFLNQESKIEFELEELENNEYKLVLNKENYLILEGTTKIYAIDGNEVYEYNKFKYKDVFKLVSMFEFRNKKEFTFEKNELLEFVNNILPKIRDNVSFNKLSDEAVKQYIPKNLGVKVYLDLNNKGDVLASVKYCYDNIEFEPNSNKIPKIARNLSAEKEVENQFFIDGFVYNTNYESYLMKDEENIYNFITNSINYYMEKYEVLISEEFKKREIKQPKIASLGVRIQNNLLNIDLAGIDFDPSELKNVLEKYKLKKKYYRLKNGEFLSLEQNKDLEFIENLTEGMDIDYASLANGKIKLPVNRSLYLNKLLGNIENVDINKDNEFKNIVLTTENGKLDEELEVPIELSKTLRIYQKTGYKWLKILDKYKFGGILADDMGLGKTLQIIAILLENKKSEEDIFKPSIVVSPSSLTLNWQNEIEKFAPTLKTTVIRGSLKERKDLITRVFTNDVVITSYDLLKRDIELYTEKNIEFKYIIADEAQYIKNSNTQNAKALKDLNGETRFALTGTPIENSLAELWSIFDYIMPGYLFSYGKFKREYETRIVKDQDEDAMKRLKTMIEPFILRRTKKEVLTELPDKTITVMKNEMEGEQEKIYLSYLAQTKKEILQEIESQGFEKSQIKILSLLTRLRQICCHPSLFIDNYQGESSKLNQSLELIEDAVSSNHKILLFSTYTSMFNIFEEKFREKDIEYYKLTGSTKVDERIKMVDEFNKNPNIKIFLISLKAGGTGLNLTGADMVIHYDPWWNISAENQATDRAYRIGQKNNVQVYKLITKNSIEEKINELQEKKSELIENVLDTNQTFINKLSKDDIMSLFE